MHKNESFSLSIHSLSRFLKFPKETKLKKYLSEVTEAVVAGQKDIGGLNKAEQAEHKSKVELFGFLPPKTKKNILLQASGALIIVIVCILTMVGRSAIESQCPRLPD